MTLRRLLELSSLHLDGETMTKLCHIQVSHFKVNEGAAKAGKVDMQQPYSVGTFGMAAHPPNLC